MAAKKTPGLFNLQQALLGSPRLKAAFEFGKTMFLTHMAAKVFEWIENTPGGEVTLANRDGKLELRFTRDGKPVDGPVDFDRG